MDGSSNRKICPAYLFLPSPDCEKYLFCLNSFRVSYQLSDLDLEDYHLDLQNYIARVILILIYKITQNGNLALIWSFETVSLVNT